MSGAARLVLVAGPRRTALRAGAAGGFFFTAGVVPDLRARRLLCVDRDLDRDFDVTIHDSPIPATLHDA
ncbi:MAG: hypothetical protein P4M07_07515 [Xanthobacteraceae bacterium]|nr:hypothetical protein [Xanthobacteraceae bacterium]